MHCNNVPLVIADSAQQLHRHSVHDMNVVHKLSGLWVKLGKAGLYSMHVL